MSTFIKKTHSRSAKFIGIAVFVFLMLTNLNISTNPEKKGDVDLLGLKISLSTPSAYALPEDAGDGGGAGGGSLGHWANYGTIMEYTTCVDVEFIFIYDEPITIVTTSVKPVYYLSEHCNNGGSSCTIGTVRKTYQGGGCV